MKVTNVKFNKYEKDKLVGFAEIELDNEFIVTSLKVMNGPNGLWVAMPSQKKGDKWDNVCYPKSKELRQEIQESIIRVVNTGQNSTKQESQTNEHPEDDLPF